MERAKEEQQLNIIIKNYDAKKEECARLQKENEEPLTDERILQVYGSITKKGL